MYTSTTNKEIGNSRSPSSRLKCRYHALEFSICFCTHHVSRVTSRELTQYGHSAMVGRDGIIHLSHTHQAEGCQPQRLSSGVQSGVYKGEVRPAISFVMLNGEWTRAIG